MHLPTNGTFFVLTLYTDKRIKSNAYKKALRIACKFVTTFFDFRFAMIRVSEPYELEHFDTKYVYESHYEWIVCKYSAIFFLISIRKKIAVMRVSELDESEHDDAKYAYESHWEWFANTLRMFSNLNSQ